MSRAAQLKRKAAEFEQKRQYDRALAMYVQAIEAGSADETDIPLYNRVGDLYLRLGDLDQAVTYYETAADLYAEGGFFNNAIALCNKVLRHAPARSAVFYKLGKISARKGFTSDAKQNFLEYAARMERGGDTEEAFRALKEFADLCPGQDDVRLMLADQLSRAGRAGEALEQLQTVYDSLVAEDRTAEAAATLERIRKLDPSFEPRRERARRTVKREGLVFIDVDYDVPPGPLADESAPVEGSATQAAPPPFHTSPPADHFGEVELPAAEPAPAPRMAEDSPLAGLTPLDDPMVVLAAHAPATAPDPLAPADDPDAGDARAAPPLPPDDATGGPQAGSAGTGDSAMGAGLVFDDDPASAAAPPVRPDDEFVDLNEWLRESEPPPNPRMTAAEEEPQPGTVQTDFADMLETFKRGVAQNVDETDSESHYDLGVAYMEMGLLDEAIGEFQTAVRGNAAPERRLRAYESLGECFLGRGDAAIAIGSLAAALDEPGLNDMSLVGVLYLLGSAEEQMGHTAASAAYFRRVLAVDIHFRDAAERLRRLEPAPR